jgi:SAM-dependent methyltransferase
MLTYALDVAAGAAFVIGRAEALPFEPAAFDLVTAAGALNYADVEPSLSEVARVMSRRGLFVPYDFSAGRRVRDDARLSDWYAQFRKQFPSPSGYSLNLRALGYRTYGLDLLDYEEVNVGIPMSLAAYIEYLLGDTGVQDAISGGQRESDIRRSCEEGVNEVFSAGTREVMFEAQIAYVRRGARLMVPIEITAFGLLAVCVILLAVVLAFQLLLPRPAPAPARALMLLVLVVVVIVAIYVWATTRMP